MEWLARWVRNLAFYFIFLSVLMNVIPQGEERKYIRFFMGLLLILVLIQPLLTVGQLEQILSWETLSEGIRQEYEDFSKNTWNKKERIMYRKTARKRWKDR